MTVTLSICIPTYNRSEYLKACLSSVLASVAGHESDIEIVISDNASTDDTGNVIRAFHETHPWIRYYRNEQNIGAERNFYLLATLAQGENIWIFGDDDVMLPQALDEVLLRGQKEIDIVVANYSSWNSSLSTCITDHALDIDKDTLLYSRDEVMTQFGVNLGYISSIIIKRSLFISMDLKEYTFFAPYGFSFMYAIYCSLPEQCRLAFISQPILINRSGNSTGFDWHRYYSIGTAMVFERLHLLGYSKRAVTKSKHHVLLRHVIPNLVQSKKRGEKTFPLLLSMIPRYWGDWLFWLGVCPLISSPKFVFRTVLAFWRLTHKGRIFGY